jgi:hypothetical protein
MLHKNLKPEEIQKFIKKHRLSEAFVVEGMTFRKKENAESHCRRNKIDAATIETVAKEEVKSEKVKVIASEKPRNEKAQAN